MLIGEDVVGRLTGSIWLWNRFKGEKDKDKERRECERSRFPVSIIRLDVELA